MVIREKYVEPEITVTVISDKDVITESLELPDDNFDD
jgi:hypothetical protein